MTDLVILIRSYNALDETALDSTRIPAQIAQGLSDKQWKLIDIVKELGPVLVSETDAIRARGVSCLVSTVKEMDRSTLDRQSTKTLVTFFTDKLSDKASMLSCIAALSALTESPLFGSGEGMEVARGVFSSVTMQGNPQAVRYTVYQLIDALMTRARPALKRMGKEFISGYCALAEGEKDPRNLMLSFGMVYVILVEFVIDENVEDLFDITFCYFPITFTPPPDDPYGISSEDLVVALRKCLCATPLFGKLALPLFLDKMQAASEKAKRQTLQAVIECYPVYGAAVCGEWAGRFSEALTIEVFHATDNEMMELALAAFTSLFATLYPDMPTARITEISEHGDTDQSMPAADSQDDIRGVAVKVVANALEELKEPDKSNAKPAVRILTAFMASSNRLARYVLDLSLSLLLAFFKDPDEVALRGAILTCLSDLLGALSLPSSSSLVHAEQASPLEPFRDDLLAAVTTGTRSPASRPPALDSLVNLIKVPGFLLDTELSYCVSAVNDILKEPSSDDEYDAALDGLIVIADLHPRIIELSTLPLLFALLPADAPRPGTPESEAYRKALSSLALLCTHPSLFELLALRLLARLEPVLSSPAANNEHNSLYAHHLLATLRSVMRAKIARGHEDLGRYSDKFLPRLLGMFLLPTVKRMDEGEVAKDPRLLLDAGKIVTIISQRLDLEQQTRFFHAMKSAFQEGDLRALLGQYDADSADLEFRPFNSDSSTVQQDTVALFSAALIAMRPTVTLPNDELLAFVRSALERSLNWSNETQAVSGRHLMASTVNKRAQDLTEFLSKEVSAFWDENVTDSTKAGADRRLCLHVCTWIAKGLVVRSDERGFSLVERILALFSDAELGPDAAAALGVIAEDNDRVLSKENFAVIRLLYKQRFFTLLLPKIVAGHMQAKPAVQAIYLTALSHLLRHLPRQLTLTELPKLLPLLISSLDLPDFELRANVIDTLSLLVKEIPMEMDNSISSMAVKILRAALADAARRRTKGAVALRISSLNFLATLPGHIPYTTLHPQKAMILKELGKAVDDPRRDVRRAAVDCRSKWYMYSG